MNRKVSILLHPCRLLLPVLLLLAGCAAQMAHRQGMALIADGKSEEGLPKLEQAAKEAPDDLEYRVHYLNAKEKVIARLLAAAQREKAAGRFDETEALYRRVLKIDSNNAQAGTGINALEQARRHAKLLEEANALVAANNDGAAQQTLTIILQENPQQSEARALLHQIEEKAGRDQILTPRMRKTFLKPVTLEFRDANLKQVLEALSRHSGLNFVLDKDVPSNLMITTFLKQVSVEEALDVMLSTNNLDKRILNDTTLLIYPDTAAKQSEHQDLIVRTFYLANANAKEVMTMLKTVLKAKNVYVDDKLNLLIMRDTPTMVELAEKLVATQDVSEPEVMLEVEVVEVQRSKLLNLGIQFPDQLTLTPLASGSTLTLNDLRHINSSSTGATITPLILNLQDQINDSNILANPRIRTHNREKAEIKIGDRVPVVTTTSTSTGFVSDSVQYVDVGLKLEVEPTIYPDDQVSIKMSLEVSSVVKQLISKDGTTVYQIGTRNASTVLRLKDGETQILGGLINDNDTKDSNRLPGLGDFPILGRLFSSQKDDTQKTELVLSITPRLVRGLAPPLTVPSKFWSGTENNPRLKPLGLSSLSTSAPDKPVADTDQPLMAKAPTVENAQPAHPAMLRWDGPAQAKVGSSFKLMLKVSSPQAIAGFPLQIKYDPAIFEAIDTVAGQFMGQGGIKADFTKRMMAGAGMIFVTQNRSGPEGAKGDGDLIEVEFRALKPAQNSPITALPTVPLGAGNQPLRQTGPTLVGITVTP